MFSHEELRAPKTTKSKSMTARQARKLWCEVSGRPRYEAGGTTSESADGTICAYDSAMRLIGKV